MSNNKKEKYEVGGLAGFTLLELILAVAIFSASAMATGYLIIEAMSTTDANSKKIQATFLSREGLEAVRAIRDAGEDFSNDLPNGEYGVLFDSDLGTWSFDGASDVSDDIYERTVLIESWGVGGNNKMITSTVRVPTITREIVVVLETILSAWPES